VALSQNNEKRRKRRPSRVCDYFFTGSSLGQIASRLGRRGCSTCGKWEAQGGEAEKKQSIMGKRSLL